MPHPTQETAVTGCMPKLAAKRLRTNVRDIPDMAAELSREDQPPMHRVAIGAERHNPGE